MIKEICFFIQTPLTKRDYDRFGSEVLQSRGFKVIFLDLTRIINPEYLNKYQPSDLSDFQNVVIFYSQKEVINYLKINNNFFGIDMITATVNSMFLYQALKRYNIQYASCYTNSIPLPIPTYKKKDIDSIKKTKRILKHLMQGYIFNDIKEIFDKFLLLLFEDLFQPPAFVLLGGRSYSPILPKPTKDTKIIWAHTFNYDLYLKYKFHRPEPIVQGDYLIFLDEYFPFHPDSLISGSCKVSVSPQKYYGGLNRFFSYIETELGLPVVIAAHPSSRYDLYPDYFQGRKVIVGKTIELVYYAKVVLAHSSTSINFAVLYKKPIIFLTSDEIEKNNPGSFICNFAKQFNKEPINVDGELNLNLDEEFKIDEDRYALYCLNYIKVPGTPDKPLWDIVADYINGLP